MGQLCRVMVISCSLLGILAASNVNAEPLRRVIDAEIAAGWKSNKITPTATASDAEFMRRVYLDLLGVVPTHDEAVKFLDDTDSQKRSKLIDRLLEHPRYAVHQADVWDMVYFGRNPPGYNTNKREGFQIWLAEQFRQNRPYNEWAGDILRAEGNTVEQGAPMFFVQYRNKPEDAIEAVTQKFLGVQLQCARCHDHPFEEWTQLDFYGMASYYARLRVVDVGKKNKQTAYAIGEMNRGDVLFTGPAIEQVPGKKGEPVKPKFLGGEKLVEPVIPEEIKDPRNFPSGKVPPAPQASRKNALADWITAVDNPYFAKAVSNRIWAQFMGKGIVQPVDNLTDSNPPSHPELLNQLSTSLVENGFDLKAFIREILNSKAYQLSSQGDVTDANPLWYERARYRALSAEELLESWMVAGGYNDALTLSGKESKGRFSPQGVTWDYVRRFFGRPNDGVGNFQGGLHEHLYLNNGQVHALITKQKGGLHATIIESEEPWEKRVERMFLQVLSRRPTPAETERFVTHLESGDDPSGRLHDAIWTLMTCSEFRFNH